MAACRVNILQSSGSFEADESGPGFVHCYGAGGSATVPSASGSAGAGAACAVKALIFTQGLTYNYTVAGIPATDEDGGSTDFNGVCIAVGGQSAANGGAGGQSSACTGDSAFSGSSGQTSQAPASAGSCAGSAGDAVGVTTGGHPDGVRGSTSSALGGSIYGAGGGIINSTTSSAAGAGAIRVQRPAAIPGGYPYVSDHNYGVNSSNSSTTVISLLSPTTGNPIAAPGDLMILIFGRASSSVTTISVPGFTEAVSADLRFRCFERIADGSESSSINVTTSSSGQFPWTLIVVKNHNNFGVYGDGSVTTTGTSADPSPPPLAGGPTVAKRLWIVATIWENGTAAIGAISWPGNLNCENVIPRRLNNNDLTYGWAYVETDVFTPESWGRVSTDNSLIAYHMTLGIDPAEGPPPPVEANPNVLFFGSMQ